MEEMIFPLPKIENPGLSNNLGLVGSIYPQIVTMESRKTSRRQKNGLILKILMKGTLKILDFYL